MKISRKEPQKNKLLNFWRISWQTNNAMKAFPYQSIKNRYERVRHSLDERSRRLLAGAEAMELGYGGISAVVRATELNARTVQKGIAELSWEVSSSRSDEILKPGRIRAPGGGRKKLSDSDPGLVEALEKLVEPFTRGDPMCPLRWTCKSTAKLAGELTRSGHPVSAGTVANILKARDYSLQSNRRRFEGKQHPDRNGQFAYIAAATEAFQSRGSPVISVDAKKKELVGNYHNAGKEWTPKGCAHEVEAYDFINPEQGKDTPFGVFDITYNVGWVSVGTDHDTAEFAVRSIARWWEEMGEPMYPHAKEILIMADGGGSNGSRNRLWKKSLQQWADREGLTLMICHFPPGTSKWNKIEHRMFCHITRNWRGKPLVSHEVIIKLIGATSTEKGLRIRAELDTNVYLTGKKVSDEEMESLNIERADFHGEWNYVIKPRVM
jgi:hypothetical protein